VAEVVIYCYSGIVKKKDDYLFYKLFLNQFYNSMKNLERIGCIRDLLYSNLFLGLYLDLILDL